MNEPQRRWEGNLRFAGVAAPGWPDDPAALCARVRATLVRGGADPYGADSLLFSFPPDGVAPQQWECLVGAACTGMPRPGDRLDSGERVAVEDYRGLDALTQAHHGPVRAIDATWRALVAHAREQGLRPRPYWRVSLRRRTLADGNLLPATEVSLFVER